jgi:hypothetical protein
VYIQHVESLDLGKELDFKVRYSANGDTVVISNDQGHWCAQREGERWSNPHPFYRNTDSKRADPWRLHPYGTHLAHLHDGVIIEYSDNTVYDLALADATVLDGRFQRTGNQFILLAQQKQQLRLSRYDVASRRCQTHVVPSSLVTPLQAWISKGLNRALVRERDSSISYVLTLDSKDRHPPVPLPPGPGRMVSGCWLSEHLFVAQVRCVQREPGPPRYGLAVLDVLEKTWSKVHSLPGSKPGRLSEINDSAVCWKNHQATIFRWEENALQTHGEPLHHHSFRRVLGMDPEQRELWVTTEDRCGISTLQGKNALPCQGVYFPFTPTK